MLERTKNSLRSGDKLKSVVSGLPVRFVKWVDRDTGLFEGEVYQRGYTRPMGYKSDEFNIRSFNMHQRNTNSTH